MHELRPVIHHSTTDRSRPQATDLANQGQGERPCLFIETRPIRSQEGHSRVYWEFRLLVGCDPSGLTYEVMNWARKSARKFLLHAQHPILPIEVLESCDVLADINFRPSGRGRHIWQISSKQRANSSPPIAEDRISSRRLAEKDAGEPIRSPVSGARKGRSASSDCRLCCQSATRAKLLESNYGQFLSSGKEQTQSGGVAILERPADSSNSRIPPTTKSTARDGTIEPGRSGLPGPRPSSNPLSLPFSGMTSSRQTEQDPGESPKQAELSNSAGSCMEQANRQRLQTGTRGKRNTRSTLGPAPKKARVAKTLADDSFAFISLFIQGIVDGGREWQDRKHLTWEDSVEHLKPGRKMLQKGDSSWQKQLQAYSYALGERSKIVTVYEAFCDVLTSRKHAGRPKKGEKRQEKENANTQTRTRRILATLLVEVINRVAKTNPRAAYCIIPAFCAQNVFDLKDLDRVWKHHVKACGPVIAEKLMSHQDKEWMCIPQLYWVDPAGILGDNQEDYDDARKHLNITAVWPEETVANFGEAMSGRSPSQSEPLHNPDTVSGFDDLLEDQARDSYMQLDDSHTTSDLDQLRYWTASSSDHMQDPAASGFDHVRDWSPSSSSHVQEWAASGFAHLRDWREEQGIFGADCESVGLTVNLHQIALDNVQQLGLG